MDPTNWNAPLYFSLAQIMAIKIVLIKSPELFLLMNTPQSKKVSKFTRDLKGEDNGLMYIPNDSTQNYPFCRLKLVVETIEHST